MKYFNPSYWFKLWVLSASLFNDETIGINAMSIENKEIKDWFNNNTSSLESINQEMIKPNSNTNYQPYNLSHQVINQNINIFYQKYLESRASQELETSTHKHHHEKRNRVKRWTFDETNNIYFYDTTDVNNVYYYSFNKTEEKIFISKVKGINEEIKNMYLAPNENRYFLSTNGNVYLKKETSDNAVRVDTYYNAPEIKNVKSIVQNSHGIFYNTANGIYSFNAYFTNGATRIEGISEEIKKIEKEINNNFYFLSTNGNVYLKKETSDNAVRVDTYYNAPEIKNVKSMLKWSTNLYYFLTNNGHVFYTYVGDLTTTYRIEGISEKIKDMIIVNNNGVYFLSITGNVYCVAKNRWAAYKIEGINEKIKNMDYYYWKQSRMTHSNVYFLSTNGNIFYLASNWWTAVRVDTYYNVPEIKNVKSMLLTSWFNVFYQKNPVFYTANGIYSFDAYFTNGATRIEGISEENGNFYFCSKNDKRWQKIKKIMIKSNYINYDYKDYFLLENKKFNYLKKDFIDWNKDTINLGLINDNIDNDIKNEIHKKYPNLIIEDIEIVEKEFSYFQNPDNKNKLFGGFSMKINIKNSNVNYSHGVLKPKFSYVTQTKLNEISSYITNDPKVKKWIEHINDWNSTLPQAIENAKTFTPELLYNWKRQEKETIKSYIRDWSYVSTLIEHELKLDELNKNVQGLKSSFDSIKNQVNDLENKLNNLNERVTNLENTSNWNCANIATVTAGAVSVIPVIGTAGGAVATVTAGACAIAGV